MNDSNYIRKLWSVNNNFSMLCTISCKIWLNGKKSSFKKIEGEKVGKESENDLLQREILASRHSNRAFKNMKY